MSTPQTPSAELNFKQCAESIRTALQTFTVLRTIPSNGIVSTPLKVALSDLVNTTVSLIVLKQDYITDSFCHQVNLNHHAAFASHPLYQELAPAVQIAVDKFVNEFKEFKTPSSTFLIAGIAARAASFRTPAGKRGISSFFYFSCPILKLHAALSTAASTPPSGPRAGKTKKQKNSVRKILLNFYCTVFLISKIFPGQTLQAFQRTSREF